MRKVYIAFLIILLFLTYLYFGTGNHSDDYIHLAIIPNWSLTQLLTLDLTNHPSYWFYMPVLYYDFFQFYAFQHNALLYDVIKIITSLSCIFLIYLFAKDYMPWRKALLFSVLFILFPLHDSTNYWVMGQYMIITPALIMYAHYLFHNNKFKQGFGIGLLGSFSSYASPPYALGLSLIFLQKKQYKKFSLFVLPQAMYVLFYITMNKITGLSGYRINDTVNPLKVFKHFVLQVATFLDVALGPTLWLKIYYSLKQLTLPSILIGCFLVYLLYKSEKIRKGEVSTELFYGLIATLFLAFCLYSLTGYYPQLAFNLGNRTTVFGSLLLTYLIVVFLINGKKSATIVLAIFILSVLGISDHWKEWNSQQQQILQNIAQNRDLETFDNTKQLFVSYNQYSQFGRISHIEYYSDAAMARAIFKYATGKDYKVSPINRRFWYKNDKIVDKKFGQEITVGDSIYVYDSNSDILSIVDRDDIHSYIDSLPDDNRHWIQLLGKDNWIRRLVLHLMPRLDYGL